MALSTPRINELILHLLGTAEMRQLALTVAIRKSMGPHSGYKGDLSQAVKVGLRRLIQAKLIIDSDGVYGLAAASKVR